MGTATVTDIEQVIEEAHAALVQMCRDGWVGEVAIVIGGNQLQVEERRRRKRKPIKRSQGSAIEVVEQV